MNKKLTGVKLIEQERSKVELDRFGQYMPNIEQWINSAARYPGSTNDKIYRLVKAGALIAAEIDHLQEIKE